MKTFTLLICFLFPIVSFSQKDSDSLYFAKMKTFTFSREVKLDTSLSLPFQDIKVWDVRPDTTLIGFSKVGNANEKINFSGGLSQQVCSFVKNNYTLKTNVPDTIILIAAIKTFWVSGFADVAYLKTDNTTQWNAGLVSNADFFLFNGKGYHALYKIDTSFILTSQNYFTKNNNGSIFRSIFARLENKNLSEVHVGKTEFSFEQIQNHLHELYNFPILTDTILNKGVYVTFSEFKNNKPSIKEFEIKKGNLSDELYVTENNEIFILHDFWGYCDGKNLYIHSAGNTFQLYRTGSTFNTRAFKSLNKKQYSMALTGLDAAGQVLTGGYPYVLITPQPSPDKYKISTTPFQLNIISGDIY